MFIDVATAQALFDEAERQGSAARDGKLLPCDTQMPVDAACLDGFVDAFVGHAFRRPLTDAEHARYVSLFKVGANNGDAASGVELVVEATLLSPLFLYKIYWGDGTSDGMATPLTASERASRLSYLMSGGPPDAELFDAVAHGKFLSDDDVVLQAHRLMMAPTFIDVVQRFHEQWLGLDDFANFAALGLDAGVATSMRHETELFIEDVFSHGRLFSDLLSEPLGFVDANLAPIYGLNEPDSTFVHVSLPKSRYFGLLTQASTMAHFRNPSQRGDFVLERLMCSAFPPHPPGIDTSVTQQPGETRRDAWAKIQASASCASCHSPIDSLGFGFEHFDSSGYSDVDVFGGKPIDASGVLPEPGMSGQSFTGVGELSALLIQSPAVSECMTRTWLSYALQRSVSDSDECAVQAATAAFVAAKLDIGELLVALTTTTPFRMRDAFQFHADTPPGPSGISVTTTLERRKLLLDFNLDELIVFTKIAPQADIPVFAEHATAIRSLEQQIRKIHDLSRQMADSRLAWLKLAVPCLAVLASSSARSAAAEPRAFQSTCTNAWRRRLRPTISSGSCARQTVPCGKPRWNRRFRVSTRCRASSLRPISQLRARARTAMPSAARSWTARCGAFRSLAR